MIVHKDPQQIFRRELHHVTSIFLYRRATFNKIRQPSPNRPITSQLQETSEKSRYRNATLSRLRNDGRWSWATISFYRLSGATRKKSYFQSPSEAARSRSRSI